MKFCFPERDTDNIEGDGSKDIENSNSGNGVTGKKGKFSNSNEKASKKWKEANFYVPIAMKDDVEKMKVIFQFYKHFKYSNILEE